MACNKPFIGVPSELLPSGKWKYQILGAYSEEVAKDHPNYIKIPCGKCTGCRAQKCREWADRMILELDHSQKAVFLTLTYDNDHLPVKYQITTGQCEMTLQKRDLTLFFKRLRKRFKDKELRYYAVGEYGKNTNRPHYHCILFGLSLHDFPDLLQQGKNELGQLYFRSEWLAKDIWKNGYCLLAETSWNSCAYVARYIKKKDFGLVSDEFVNRSREPEFSVMSRNPGIGMYYPIEHPEYKEKSKFYYGDENGSVEVYFPKAFLQRLEISDPDLYEELKKKRSKMANDREITKLYHTDLSSMELYDIAEEKIENSEKVIDYYRCQV